MSNNTVSQKPYADKSMNGVISYDDGQGTSISGGVITTNTFSTTNFNADNIQGVAPADNITLYTNTTGNISVGSSVANTITIDANSSTNINYGTGKPTKIASLLLNAGTIFSSGIPDITLAPSASVGVVKIGGAQQIEGSNNASGLQIGNNLTAGTMYLGNSTVGPSTTHDAVNPYELVNYQTAQSIVGGASLLGLPNVWTNTNEFQSNFTVGGTVSINASGASTSSVGGGTNTGVLALGNTANLSTTLQGSTVNINNGGGGNVNIASILNATSVITIGNNSGNCTLNIGRQMTPTYSYTDANGSNVGTAIGYYNTSTATTAAVINTTITQMLSMSIPDDGVYIVTAQVRFQSNNATNNTSCQNTRAGIGSSSANYDYCSACLGDTTMLLTYNNNATKRYWEVPLTFVGRLAFGASLSLNAEGVSNNGIQAIYRYMRYCRIA